MSALPDVPLVTIDTPQTVLHDLLAQPSPQAIPPKTIPTPKTGGLWGAIEGELTKLLGGHKLKAHTIAEGASLVGTAESAVSVAVDLHPAASNGSIGLPAWLGPMASKLVLLAESTFPGDSPEKKEAWVKSTLTNYARLVPTGPVPAFIAGPLEGLLIDAAVSIAYNTLKANGYLDAAYGQAKIASSPR